MSDIVLNSVQCERQNQGVNYCLPDNRHGVVKKQGYAYYYVNFLWHNPWHKHPPAGHRHTDAYGTAHGKLCHRRHCYSNADGTIPTVSDGSFGHLLDVKNIKILKMEESMDWALQIIFVILVACGVISLGKTS